MNKKLIISSILGMLLVGVMLYYNSYNTDFNKLNFPDNNLRIKHVLLEK